MKYVGQTKVCMNMPCVSTFVVASRNIARSFMTRFGDRTFEINNYGGSGMLVLDLPLLIILDLLTRFWKRVRP